MIPSKVFAALFLCLFGVEAAEVDLVIQFPHNEFGPECTVEEKVLLDTATKMVLIDEGFYDLGMSTGWQTFDHADRLDMPTLSAALLEEQEAEAAPTEAPIEGAGRRLPGCDDFCSFMCRSVGTYCHCCAGDCCGGSRRRSLRGLLGPADVASRVDDIRESLVFAFQQQPIVCVDTAKPEVLVTTLSRFQTPHFFEG